MSAFLPFLQEASSGGGAACARRLAVQVEATPNASLLTVARCSAGGLHAVSQCPRCNTVPRCVGSAWALPAACRARTLPRPTTKCDAPNQRSSRPWRLVTHGDAQQGACWRCWQRWGARGACSARPRAAMPAPAAPGPAPGALGCPLQGMPAGAAAFAAPGANEGDVLYVPGFCTAAEEQQLLKHAQSSAGWKQVRCQEGAA